MENTAHEMISGTKSTLRFRGLGNTSSLRKLFFESLSVVFVASVPCPRVVASLVSSYCFLRGHRWLFFVSSLGLIFMSSLRHFYAFVSTGLPFVDCATYFGRYLMYGDIHCTDFTCISYTSYISYKLYLSLFPCYSVVIFFISVYFCMTNHNIFSLIDAFFCGSKVVVEWFALQIGLRSE